MNKKIVALIITIIVIILIGISIYCIIKIPKQEILGDKDTSKLKDSIQNIENDTERAIMVNMFWGENILTDEELKTLY